jgi:hypothetical protein
MSAKILQIIKPSKSLYNVYVGNWILKKDKKQFAIFLDEVKSEGFTFPNNIKEIAQEFSSNNIGLLDRIHVFALALVERGKKTSVEPFHLVDGSLVTSDDVEGFLGMYAEGEPIDEEGGIMLSYKIKALEVLRDG